MFTAYEWFVLIYSAMIWISFTIIMFTVKNTAKEKAASTNDRVKRLSYWSGVHLYAFAASVLWPMVFVFAIVALAGELFKD